LGSLAELSPSFDGATTESAIATPDAPLVWQLDFGRVVSGFVELDFDAPAGTVDR
jgi:hypothetical protein